MKLDPKCISDVLMAIEETVTYYEKFQYIAGNNVPKRLLKYSHDQIVYHIQYCSQSGYLVGCEICGNGAMIFVDDLSTDGHKHLADTRENTIIGQSKVAMGEMKRKSIRDILLLISGKLPKILSVLKELISI